MMIIGLVFIIVSALLVTFIAKQKTESIDKLV
jgi:hypothetical protein